MRRGAVLLLFLMVTTANAEFLMERVEVTLSDIKSDGSVKVHESIKFIMYGEYSQSLYDSGISNNQLAFWSTNTGLKDVKFHVNPSKVDIRDLRLRPQPRTGCNPIQGSCHGELILDYEAYPSYADNSSTTPLAGTGIFTVEQYKPRTKRYTLNPSALSFTSTPESNIVLEDSVYLTINLPAESTVLDINPQPAGTNLALPSHVGSLTWTDIVLVRFSLVFDVEESIDREVTDFFGGIMSGISKALSGPHGFALAVIIIILAGSYLYITASKRRVEE
ncbi:MAG: hypothetical protein QXD77_03120 [Candidatus Aenigmatarchaeota archaeon]